MTICSKNPLQVICEVISFSIRNIINFQLLRMGKGTMYGMVLAETPEIVKERVIG
jgi:hypothetical protein